MTMTPLRARAPAGATYRRLTQAVPLLLLSGPALAADFPVKVHDRSGLLAGAEVSAEIVGGPSPVIVPLRDDGQDPDVVSGDRLYTGKAVGVELQSGKVTVRAGSQSWTGDFLFDPGSDPVILVGLEGPGKAGVSTHEVMFFPDQKRGPPPGGAGGPGPGPGGPGPGGVGPGGPGSPDRMSGAPTSPGAGEAPRSRSTTPQGMWLGWGLLLGAMGGLGALAYLGMRRPNRAPVLSGPIRETTATRGPRGAFEGVDLLVGPNGGPSSSSPVTTNAPAPLSLGEGRWTPQEIAIAAMAAMGGGRPVRVVVTESWRVEAEDGFAELSAALRGKADLVWEG